MENQKKSIKNNRRQNSTIQNRQNGYFNTFNVSYRKFKDDIKGICVMSILPLQSEIDDLNDILIPNFGQYSHSHFWLNRIHQNINKKEQIKDE